MSPFTRAYSQKQADCRGGNSEELGCFEELKRSVILFWQVVLETEITNKAALRLYENLGFVRDKRLFRYYLNGVDALRLKLWLR